VISLSMGVKNIRTQKAKLLAQHDEPGGYTVYVFENLDFDKLYDKYVMCTRFPNWQCDELNIGDTGFLKFREVEGGIDCWYDSISDTNVPYKYTNIHFLDFVREQAPTKEIVL